VAEQSAGSKMSDFERWEKRYGAPGYLFGTAPNAFLAAQADRLRGRKTALSVADGEGRNGVWLEQGSRCSPSTRHRRRHRARRHVGPDRPCRHQVAGRLSATRSPP